jgi:hypothetical protein
MRVYCIGKEEGTWACALELRIALIHLPPLSCIAAIYKQITPNGRDTPSHLSLPSAPHSLCRTNIKRMRSFETLLKCFVSKSFL